MHYSNPSLPSVTSRQILPNFRQQLARATEQTMRAIKQTTHQTNNAAMLI